MLDSARTQALNKETNSRNVTGVVEDVLRDDYRTGRKTYFRQLWETINRDWPYKTLHNRAAYL